MSYPTGSVTSNTAPSPAADANVTSPPRSATILRVTNRPRPEPCQFFPRVGVLVAALQHLDDRTDRRERVADLVGNPGGEQAERGHLLLVQHVRLRLLEFAGALGDPHLQRVVQLAQMFADVLE